MLKLAPAALAGLIVAGLAGSAMALTPEEIVAGCQPGGAYGQIFGASRMVGKLAPPRIAELPAVVAPAEYAPFIRVEVDATPVSKKIHSIGLGAELADAGAAKAMQETLIAAIVASGRFPHRDETEAWPTFDAEDERDDEPARGLRMEVSRRGNELSITCVDRALSAKVWDEATGRNLTERPQPPGLPLPGPPPTLAICADPASRKAFVESLKGRLTELTNLVGESYTYRTRLMRWRSDQLIAAGVWTQDDLMTFAVSTLNDPEIDGAVQRSWVEQTYLLGRIAELYEMIESKDEDRACRTGVSVMADLHRAMASYTRQWKIIEDRFAAIAGANGVTLD